MIGTGDFTHPDWFGEIREKLVETEPGLFRLKPSITAKWAHRVPRSCRRPVRFVLTAEISNIYKKNGITRKNHNLIFMPGIESVRKFNVALDRIGNIRSDGRPILGLDARNLLETMLEVEETGFFVPAHIWTPWFSLLGAKSGFDTIDECFEDLSPHVFALETGLSSDPPMNWRCSGLDGRTLISNSDAHSPDKLGREANIFNTRLSFHSIRYALCGGQREQFEGTIEFYPEEGKYHLDGHRKCGVRLHPDETRRVRYRCPECGRPLTLGVLHRVEQLADRTSGELPSRRHKYWNLIPLKEILGEIFQVGSSSKRVGKAYETLLAQFGSEIHILKNADLEYLRSGPVPLLAEAVDRMRRGKIRIAAGFDGEFGKIQVFDCRERIRLKGQRSLFIHAGVESPATTPIGYDRSAPPAAIAALDATPPKPTKKNPPDEGGLNSEQKKAVHHSGSPLIIVAGPGTGKTRTLTHRVAYLIDREQVPPAAILALTFTRKAAEEMAQRLRFLLKNPVDLPTVATFHALCLQILKEIEPDRPLTVIDDVTRLAMVRQAVLQVKCPVEDSPAQLEKGIIEQKQRLRSPRDCLASVQDPQSAALAYVYEAYQRILTLQNLCDYEELVFRLVERFKQGQTLPRRYCHILVDEYQDLNFGQYRLVGFLASAGTQLFVIGDPDQAIYGFRGADVRYFQCFLADYPDAHEIRLQRNYRSTEAILNASHRVMAAAGNTGPPVQSGIFTNQPVTLIECASDRSEAVVVGREIERLVGGTGFHFYDFDSDVSETTDPHGFGDIAVLFRTRAQGRLLAEVLERGGIPCQHLDKTEAFQQPGKRVVLSGLNLICGSGSYFDLIGYSEAAAGGCSAADLQPFVSWSLSKNRPLCEALASAGRIPIPGMKTEQQRRLVALAFKIDALQKRVGKDAVILLVSALLQGLKAAFLRSHPALQDPEDIFFRTAREAGRDLGTFLLRMTLSSDADIYDQTAQKVSLLTFHAAKGLEFPVVFITGCEEDLLPLVPLAPKEHPQTDIEEERRLLYVGMTRARRALFLSWARRRRVHGRVQQRCLSRFIEAIPPELFHYRKPSQRLSRHRQLTLF